MRVEAVLREHERSVCVVHYLAIGDLDTQELYHGGMPPQNPACLLQVTLDVEKLSPSGKLIRIGETRGDEIMGWTRLAALEVVEVLGVVGADGVTVVPVPASVKVIHGEVLEAG